MLRLTDCHNHHRSASPGHSAYHNSYRAKMSLLCPRVYLVHSWCRMSCPWGAVYGKQDKNGLLEVEVGEEWKHFELVDAMMHHNAYKMLLQNSHCHYTAGRTDSLPQRDLSVVLQFHNEDKIFCR